MKSLTVRLPSTLVARLDAESRDRGVSRSDIVRERLEADSTTLHSHATVTLVSDLIGSVDGLPADMSARKKDYLNASSYGRKRHR